MACNILCMHRTRILLGFLFLLAIFALGWQLGTQLERENLSRERAAFEERFALTGSGSTFTHDPEKEVDMGLFWTVWKLLDKNFVDPSALNIDTLRFGAVKGLVEGVGDPYSGFMTPKENNEFQETLRGTLEGIGAELTLRDDAIVVVAPLKGSPAANAGLLPLDIIVAVDGQSLEGVSLQDAVHRIRGERGTEVKLTILRPPKNGVPSNELIIPIIREKITVPSVEHELIETGTGTVGYVAMNQFGDGTTGEMRAALQELAAESLSGIVLDLRSNGGGYLDGAVEVASFFLTKGKIVSVHKRGTEVETRYAFGDPIAPSLPMVVLINEGSASASEIVAGALQDLGRATIVGKKSFGKGTVQEVIDLPGGSSLRVTIARWHTPSGRDLSKEGVMPDIEISLDMAEFAKGNDAQKDAAISAVFRRRK